MELRVASEAGLETCRQQRPPSPRCSLEEAADAQSVAVRDEAHAQLTFEGSAKGVRIGARRVGESVAREGGIISIVMSDPYEDKHQLAFQGGGPAARMVPVTFCIDDVQVSAW
jgi:hypothetical protein